MSGSTWALLPWLSQHHGAPKHQQWVHPIVICLLHYIIVIPSTVLVNDFVLQSTLREQTSRGAGNATSFSISQCNTATHAPSEKVAFAVLLYCFTLLMLRIHPRTNSGSSTLRKAAVYEFTWLCNSCLVLGPLGMLTCRPLLVMGPAIAVSIDQFLWFVDWIGWALSGFRKFPVGVVTYLTWPTATNVSRITSTHHLWTIPLYMHAVDMNFGLSSWYMSIYCVVSHVFLSRWLTPFTLPILEDQGKLGPTKKDRLKHGGRNAKSSSNTPTIKYLNVNLAHELWKDIKWRLPPGYYMLRLLVGWQILNFLVFCLLIVLAHLLK